MNKREYQRKYQIERYHRRRDEAVASLGGKCVRCGTTDSLELDHIDPATKSLDVARLWGVSKERFWQEIAKCQLLCKTCHARKTADEQRQEVHGTWGQVRRRKCKCDTCGQFVSDYHKKRRLSRLARN